MDTPCSNHDVHNALKWGLFSWITNTSLTDAAFIAIESLRNGFSMLEEEIGRWVVVVVHWADEEDLLDPLEAAALWGAVGVEPKWVEHLVDLGILFRGGRLLVSQRHRGKNCVWADIMNCMRHALKFTKFSDSRWCTLGKSCRQVIHAQLLGLNSLVQAVLDDKENKDYLIKGYRLLTPDVQEFITTAAFAAYPAEALLAELLEDDRLCLQLEYYQNRLKGEMNALIDMPGLVWELASDLCGDNIGAKFLRSQVLGCAHVSLGFIRSRVWQHCQQWPWKLATGNIDQNIADLAAMDAPPQESVTRKIWALANQGYPRSTLVEGVLLLQHLGWTSTTVEQQHASATMVKRVHDTFGVRMLMARALLHTARLFYYVDPLDRDLHMFEAKLQGQFAKEPHPHPCKCHDVQEDDGNVRAQREVRVVGHKRRSGEPAEEGGPNAAIEHILLGASCCKTREPQSRSLHSRGGEGAEGCG